MAFKTVRSFIQSKVEDDYQSDLIFNFLIENVSGIDDSSCYTTFENDILFSTNAFTWDKKADEDGYFIGYNIVIVSDCCISIE